MTILVPRWVAGFLTIYVVRSVTDPLPYFGWMGGLVMFLFEIDFGVCLIYQRTNCLLWCKCLIWCGMRAGRLGSGEGGYGCGRGEMVEECRTLLLIVMM